MFHVRYSDPLNDLYFIFRSFKQSRIDDLDDGTDLKVPEPFVTSFYRVSSEPVRLVI